jgi:hypothetical protein
MDDSEDQTDKHQESGTCTRAHAEDVKHSDASNDTLRAKENGGEQTAFDSDGDASMSLSDSHNGEEGAPPTPKQDPTADIGIKKKRRGNAFKSKLDKMQQSWRQELDDMEEEHGIPADYDLSQDDALRELDDREFYKHFP